MDEYTVILGYDEDEHRFAIETINMKGAERLALQLTPRDEPPETITIRHGNHLRE